MADRRAGLDEMAKREELKQEGAYDGDPREQRPTPQSDLARLTGILRPVMITCAP